jgi:hypothetical protein
MTTTTPTLTEAQAFALVEAGKVNTCHFIWSKERRTWCVYLRKGEGPGREWQDAESFRDCIIKLTAEAA